MFKVIIKNVCFVYITRNNCCIFIKGGITEAEWGLIKDFKVLHQSLLESVDANSFSESLSICFFFDWRIHFVTLFRNRLYLFVSSLVLADVKS